MHPPSAATIAALANLNSATERLTAARAKMLNANRKHQPRLMAERDVAFAVYQLAQWSHAAALAADGIAAATEAHNAALAKLPK